MLHSNRIQTQSIFERLKGPGNLLFALKSATIVVSIVFLYFQDLVMVFNDATRNEATSYILVVPMLLIYLVYRKRKMLRAMMSMRTMGQQGGARHISMLAGILLCTTAAILYWYGSYTFTPLEFHVLTIPIFAAGLTLILFNYSTLRQAMFPIAFLGFLVPPPSEILYGLGSTLSVISSEASTVIVRAFGIPAILTGEFGAPTIMITRPDGNMISFAVDIACSGIYSLIGFLIFATFIAFIVRDKFWKKMVTLITGLPLIYFLNILRITIIVGIGYQMGEQFALEVFHLLGGWVLIFLGTLILLMISEKVFKAQVFNKKKDTCVSCGSRSVSSTRTSCYTCGRITKYPLVAHTKTDVTKIVAVALATIMLLSIQTPVYALTQGPAQILVSTPAGEQGNPQILPNVTGYTVQFLYRDTEFEKLSDQDLSLVYFYKPQEEEQQPVWVTLEIADTIPSLHRWEMCLITWPQTHGYQPGVTQLELSDVKIFDNPPITARYFGFQYHRTNVTQLVLYWYETSVFTIDNSSQQKHVKLSLISYPESPEDISYTKAQLLPIAESIASYWQPIKTWLLISLFLSQHGLELALSTTTMLIVLLALHLLELRRKTKLSTDVWNKLSRQNQQLIDAIRKAQRNAFPTIGKIVEIYQNASGEVATTAQLEQRMKELEKIGLIRSTIGNNQDEPTQTWKIQAAFWSTRQWKSEQ